MAKKNKNERIPYTPEQIQTLLNSEGAKELKQLAQQWGRTYESLRRKRYAVRNKDRDIAAKRRYKSKLTKRTQGKYKYTTWTLAEEQKILSSKLSDIELAKEMGRTVASIWQKRARLLKKGKTNGHGYRKGDTEDTIPFPFAEG